jgi:hypothetical protein
MRNSFLSNRFRTFLFSYRHAGAEWNLEIRATSEEDARARIDRLQYATYEGELVAKVPAAAGLLARAYVFVRNSLAPRKID